MNTISDREHVPPRETCCLSTSYGRPGSTYTPSGNYYSKCVEGPAKAPRKHSSPSLINFGRLFSVNIFARCPRSRFAAFFLHTRPRDRSSSLRWNTFIQTFLSRCFTLFRAVSKLSRSIWKEKGKLITYMFWVIKFFNALGNFSRSFFFFLKYFYMYRSIFFFLVIVLKCLEILFRVKEIFFLSETWKIKFNLI